jgi:hypothetical protein
VEDSWANVPSRSSIRAHRIEASAQLQMVRRSKTPQSSIYFSHVNNLCRPTSLPRPVSNFCSFPRE